jgi:multiple sugar transport system substrate-binding protein
MARQNGWTRRHVLGTAGAVAFGGGRALAAPPVIKRGTKVSFWGGLIFSDAANKLQTDTIKKWGADNGVETEVVMINQNETVQKVSAAVESKTMPDALDLGLDLLLLLTRQGVFLPLDDIYASLGAAQGGWFKPVENAVSTVASAGGGARTGIPYGVSGNMLHRRIDVLSKAGFSNAAATWEELKTQATAVNKPPLYGLGLALSNVGDGNTQVGTLQSYGGRIADDSGKKVMIKSAATRTYLAWVKDAWDKKLFPPGNTTWDGAGDNNAYLSGQAVFIANTGSVGLAARKNDPDLYKATGYSALPGGPKGVVSPMDPQLRAVPKTARDPDAAKALIEHLTNPVFLNEYYKVAIYGPVLQGQAKLAAYNSGDPILAGLLDLVEKGTAPAYPDVYNAAWADAMNNFVVPKMIQRVVIDGWDFDRAMDESQTRTQEIYDKYK